MPVPEVTPLRIGECRGPDFATRRGGALRMARFPAGAALIGLPDGRWVLFDTGYGRAFFDATRALPERAYRWTTPVRLDPHESLPKALGGQPPSLVILSHLHADHVAGLFDLDPTPPVLLSGEALARLGAMSRVQALKAGCPRLLRDRLLALPARFFHDLPQVAPPPGFAGFGPVRDVTGQGDLLLVPLPGHGDDQHGLFLPRSSHGPLFLIADAAWSVEALRRDTPPPRWTLARLGDAAAYLATFAALRGLMRQRTEITLLPAHCPQALARKDKR